jgi:hypothetical protein
MVGLEITELAIELLHCCGVISELCDMMPDREEASSEVTSIAKPVGLQDLSASCASSDVVNSSRTTNSTR